MTVADDLRAGANYIREHGHTKRVAEADDGSVCTMGGIARGMGINIMICYGAGDATPEESLRFGEALIALDNYLKDNNLTKRASIADWSDHTFADVVIASMEKAAAWTEEQA